MKLNLLGLDHIVLLCADVGVMEHFYVDVLGCSVARRTESLLQLRAGTALIDLKPATFLPAQSRLDHFCLQYQPVAEQALLAYLDAHKVPRGVFESRFGAQGQGLSLYIQDPEGNRIELKPSSGA
ncbi:VOC family protein [Shewanella cyperi]|uniref:VOC family protein n=1 Tax=Shewanella cyperi TaxID=2814292 RepID=UPI001A95302C|nr:VOC family protein [Shewanella cyperi]QSX39989.1 VOC family protein [Shewanella cyperi]